MFHLHSDSGGADVEAVISPRAAALKALRVDGVDLVEPTTASVDLPGMSGAVLVPWPNRVAGAVWEYDARPQYLENTEPELGNANHGLLADTTYNLIARDESSITLSAPVHGRPGYPFTLATQVRYSLGPEGLTVEHLIRNDGDETAPVAVGAHPYLRVGDSIVADLMLNIDAASAVILDAKTHLPVATVPVDAATDVRSGRRVADAVRHICYTDLSADSDGRVRHTLTSADGRATTVWADHDFGWAQVWITDQPPGGPGLAIAIEPMTAPPDALNSGAGLHWLAPGELWCPSWGISSNITGTRDFDIRWDSDHGTCETAWQNKKDRRNRFL